MKRKHFWAFPFLMFALATGCGRGGGDPQIVEGDKQSVASSMDQKPEPTTDSGMPAGAEEESAAMPPSVKEQAPVESATQAADAGADADAMIQPEKEADSESAKVGHNVVSDVQGNASVGDEQMDATTEAPQFSAPENESVAAPVADQQSGLQISSANPMWKPEFAPVELEEKRSTLTLGVNLSEGAYFFPATGPSSPFQASSTSHLVGTANLLKNVHRFSTRINFKGGGNFNHSSGSPWSGKETQALLVREDITWEKTSLTLEDSLNGFAGGSFGMTAFGGAALSASIGGISGGSDLSGANDFSGLGTVQHVTNAVSGFLTHELTARSGITAAGAYALAHYFGAGYVDSQQVTAFLGYNRQFTPRTNVFLSYAYQYWKFQGAESTASNSIQLACTRQLSRRINLTLGGGPQFTNSQTPIDIGGTGVVIPSSQTGFNASAVMAYDLRKGKLNAYYERLVTNGSGLFTAANTDIVSLNMTRSLSRFWTATVSGGFVRLTNVGNQSSPAVAGNAFQYGFASVALQRTLSRHFSMFASYQFNDQTNSSTCAFVLGCGTTSHTALLSISWHANPIRLGRDRSQAMPIFPLGPGATPLPVDAPSPEEPQQ